MQINLKLKLLELNLLSEIFNSAGATHVLSVDSMRATTTKYFVMLINAVMLVVGGLLVSLGLYGMNVGSQVSHLVRTMAPTYTMLLGIVLILVSLWGVYAASNEDPLLLQIVRDSGGDEE